MCYIYLFTLRHLDIIYSIQDLQRDIFIRIKLLSDIRVFLRAIMSSKRYLSQRVILPFGPKTDFTIYLQKKVQKAQICLVKIKI